MSYFGAYEKTTIGNSKYQGNSIVDGLKKGGYEKYSSYQEREKLAKINGIKNYKGTPEQNTYMLNKLKKGDLKVKEKAYFGYIYKP